jgi:hypothetical protein
MAFVCCDCEEVNFYKEWKVTQIMEGDPEITLDNNNYNFINNILYSKIKHFVQTHISDIIFVVIFQI